MPKRTSKTDPTNQRKTRNRNKADFKRRLTKARNEILKIVSGLTFTRVKSGLNTNASSSFWKYALTELLLEFIQSEIERIINEMLQTMQDERPSDFWASEYAERSFRAGAENENNDLNVLLLGIIPFLFDTNLITTTTTYRRLLDDELFTNYRAIRSLSQRTSDQLFQAILAGMRAGESPTAIRRAVIRRFNVSNSNARRIVETEINRINNNGRMAVTELYRDELGVNAAVLHVSALLPTTRRNHGLRHGNIYSVEDQRRWWDTGANRINCHCSVRTVVLDDDNQPDLSNRLMKTLQKERVSFFKN